jgi:hypothetical protein
MFFFLLRFSLLVTTFEFVSRANQFVCMSRTECCLSSNRHFFLDRRLYRRDQHVL